MIRNYVKSMLKKDKKLFSLVFALVTMFAFSTTISAQDIQFQLAPKEKLIESYKAQFKNFYDRVPADILQKHAKTIAKVNKKITDEKLAGAITSQASQFDLNYYGDTARYPIS